MIHPWRLMPLGSRVVCFHELVGSHSIERRVWPALAQIDEVGDPIAGRRDRPSPPRKRKAAGSRSHGRPRRRDRDHAEDDDRDRRETTPKPLTPPLTNGAGDRGEPVTVPRATSPRRRRAA